LTSQIASKADFGDIRYAQLWEDADVLLAGLEAKPGSVLVSICSAGDNALSMLVTDPKKVVVVDLSPAQIMCLELRIAAYRTIDHQAFLELMGSRRSKRRASILSDVVKTLPAEQQSFWNARKDEIVRHGVGGAGKFENYFRIFRTRLLPFVHRRSVVEDVFSQRNREERLFFLERRWNNLRWRLLLKTFFSNYVMGRVGRDPAFFDHVEGTLGEHVARKIRHAFVENDPALNPYLAWILTGKHREALPHAWREENYAVIRDRLDRLDIRPGSLETFTATGEKADGFNLSDIFEYMDEPTFEAVYGSIVAASNPGARLVYWNMMVPRRRPAPFEGRTASRPYVERDGKADDKAFFYSDFVVEEVLVDVAVIVPNGSHFHEDRDTSSLTQACLLSILIWSWPVTRAGSARAGSAKGRAFSFLTFTTSSVKVALTRSCVT
jgi:S-adenosylmethionine-diacylglycerol 3-amino-3-carboxypropyl transferase